MGSPTSKSDIGLNRASFFSFLPIIFLLSLQFFYTETDSLNILEKGRDGSFVSILCLKEKAGENY